MRIAIVGGSGFAGTAIARFAALEGHQVRALMRNPPEPELLDPILRDVEYRSADMVSAQSLRGAFDDIDAVVHAAGIARESQSETFRDINIEGTRNVVAECRRTGSPRLVFLSSLGADRGASEYHRSKRYAEMLVREYGGEWTILRPGNVYGVGAGQIALFLQLVRMLPVVPVVGDPDTAFQPIASDDLAAAVVACCVRNDLSRRSIEIAGVDVTSQRDLYERITRIVDRRPPLLRLPLPMVLAASRLLEAVGATPPVWKDQLTVIREGNVLLNRQTGMLGELIGRQPRSLDDKLREIARETPEQFPEIGSGRVVRRRFCVDIENSLLDPAQLMQVVRREFAQLMPLAIVEVGSEQESEDRLIRGATISLTLPVRGHVQVRVEEVTKYSVSCVTLAGHPLSGVVRFLSEQRGDLVRFETQTFDRPRNRYDRLMMAVLGTHLKRITWLSLLRNVAERTGGEMVAPPRVETAPLDEPESKRIQQWMHELVTRRLEQHGYALSSVSPVS